MGRPPLQAGLLRDQVFQMRVSGEFLESVDGWRVKQPDQPSRAEAIHRLVGLGLSARKSRSKPAR
jgi:hypothetical protein